MGIDQIVASELATRQASESTVRLWLELYAEYENGGPAAVKAFVADRVKKSVRRADKEVKEIRSIASSASRAKRKKR